MFPGGVGVDDPARWLLDRFAADGTDALSALNGSHLAIVEHDGEALVATDPLRSWECFYTDATGVRTFGTAPAPLVRALDDPPVRRRSQLEFLYLGTVLGDRTLFEPVHRVPFDGYLTADEAGEFSRFVYRPESFDHVAELRERLERAIERRAHYPGPKGLLLSAGQDSRTLLAEVPDVERCYTVGDAGSREVRVAEKLATQYGAEHIALEPDAAYLLAGESKRRGTLGLRESLHVHHAAYSDGFDVRTMYHGLLYDTLFKGYFLEREDVEFLGMNVPTRRPSTDPAPIDSLLDTLGYLPDGSRRIAEDGGGVLSAPPLDDPEAFMRRALDEELAACRERADSVHNAMDLLVIRNQPALSFRSHLADEFLESFVAVDAELLDWHLRTPPRHRHPDVVDEAIAGLDGDIFRHRPPSEPHRSYLANQAERFVRRKLPFLRPFEAAWPDWRTLYETYDLDDELFPPDSDVRDLPVRQKLRVHDMRWWLSFRTAESQVDAGNDGKINVGHHL